MAGRLDLLDRPVAGRREQRSVAGFGGHLRVRRDHRRAARGDPAGHGLEPVGDGTWIVVRERPARDVHPVAADQRPGPGERENATAVLADEVPRAPAEVRPVVRPGPRLVNVARERQDGLSVPVLELGGVGCATSTISCDATRGARVDREVAQPALEQDDLAVDQPERGSRRRASWSSASSSSCRLGWSTWMIPRQQVGQDRRVVGDRRTAGRLVELARSSSGGGRRSSGVARRSRPVADRSGGPGRPRARPRPARRSRRHPRLRPAGAGSGSGRTAG